MNECNARPCHIFSTSELREILKDRNLLYVSRVTGISYATIRSVATNPKANPQQSTLATISAYLSGAQQ
jgi:hypothetical protein